MPYKKQDHEITCPRCNKIYTVQTQAFIRKSKDPKYGMLCSSCRAKVQYEEKTLEERQAMFGNMREKAKAKQALLSDEDKEKQKQKRREGIKKYWAEMSDDKRQQVSEKRSEDRKAFINGLTEEEMKRIGDKISASKKEAFQNMSDEERSAYKKMRQSERDRYWNSLSEERKDEIRQILRNNSRTYWDNITEEEMDIRRKRTSEMRKKLWDDMDKTERNEFFKSLHESGRVWFKNMTDEERAEYGRKISEGLTTYWGSLSDEQMDAIRKQRSASYNAKRANMTPEEYDQYTKILSNNMKSYWVNMNADERERRQEINRNMWRNLPDDDNSIRYTDKEHIILNKKFEKMFDNSMLSDRYYYEPELMMKNNGVFHSWDYGIYDRMTNELVMVVDLDGSYYHADMCDYDGFNSREEHDERRTLSIPDDSNVKYFIIYENILSKSFELMLQALIKNYDEFVNDIFKYCRSMPFPSPHYSEAELYKSWNNLVEMDCDNNHYKSLSLNTRVGDRIIQHFHESIYHAHRNGKVSPYDAWYDDELLKKCIKNRIIYQTYLNPNKILQGFNVSKIAQRVSVFSAGRAKMLIHKYLNDCNEIFDPFSGFSGRMLGAVSLGKTYIG